MRAARCPDGAAVPTPLGILAKGAIAGAAGTAGPAAIARAALVTYSSTGRWAWAWPVFGAAVVVATICAALALASPVSRSWRLSRRDR